MSIIEQIRETFRDIPIGSIFTTSEIKHMVNARFGTNEGSVIPSDCCYNMTNKGIKGNAFENFNIFVQIKYGVYQYVGEKYTDAISQINQRTVEYITDECQENTGNVCKSHDSKKRKTSRNVSEGLRYKVLKRDNFKCCACGASPAKNPAVELHIDHIIPWSKGGETEMENLQTLCSKCNLGKSDSL